ncbi:MAG: hypothetical protein M3Y81_10000 [Chloroflexota bacterium]|nr:hypothetical protein [Chloroflexota bacterium]
MQPRPLGVRLCFSLLLAILLLSDALTGWASLIPPAQAAAATPPSAQSQMTFQQFLKLSQKQHQTTPFTFPRQVPQNQHAAGEKLSDATKLPPSAEPAKMTPISQPLTTSLLAGTTGGTPLDLVGSDQRLEIQIPTGALDVSQASIAGGTKPGGTLTLHVSQMYGHFAGQVSLLGSYTLQVVDAAGHPVTGIRLRTPVTFVYHYQPAEIALLDLDPDLLFMTWPDLTFAARQAHQPVSAFTIPLQNDASTHTLTGQSTVLGSGIFDMGGGDAQNQSAPIPHMASVQGNSGQMAYAYPLAVPPGPPGATPSLTLTYSSQSTNGRYSITSPTGSVGEGWALSMGVIAADQYPSTSADPGTRYSISVGNVSDRLASKDGTSFLTEHLSNLRVHLFTPAGRSQPCFGVWDTAGTYYEFGCTDDSLQYHTVNGTRTNYEWDLDHVTPANQGPGTANRYITITYLQDLTSAGVRGSALKQIVYGTSTGNQVAGTIDFFYWAPYEQSPWTLAYDNVPGYYGNGGICPSTPATTHRRCDDPVDYTGGLPAPAVFNAYTLKTITSYVGDDSNSSHAAYRYSFNYFDVAFRGCWDDNTQIQEYCAGSHLLQNVTPTVYQNGVAHQLKKLDVGYSGDSLDFYTDTSHQVSGGSSPKPNYTQQTFWRYLTSYMDTQTGVGGTITYDRAHNNTHGTSRDSSTGDNRYDPFYCNTHTCEGSFNNPDDRAWSIHVVTSLTMVGKDSSATSLAPTTITYHYQLTTVGSGCPSDSQTQDCVGYVWSPQSSSKTSDGDWLDYYHGELHGFQTVYRVSPANDTTARMYATTDGWNTPEGDYGNYNSGSLEEEDVYSGSGTGEVLLRKTVNSYAGNNHNPDSCDGTYDLAYVPCAVLLTSSRTTFYEGSSNPNPPWVQTDNTYIGYDPNTGLGSGYQLLHTQQVSGSNVATTTSQWQYLNQDTTSNNWEYYHIGLVSHSELDDSSGHVWQCQDTAYDEGAPAGVPRPSAGWPTSSKAYSNCADQAHTAITAYQAYNVDGEAVASVDGVGTANSSLYSSNGCTLATAPLVKPPAWTASRYTSCATYDTPYLVRPLVVTNALGQTNSFAYDYGQGGLPINTTDANGKPTATTYSYDSNGNTTVSTLLPGKSSGYTSQSSTNSTCADSSTLPCFEIDSHSSLYSNAVARTFYDGLGRAVETRTPGPSAGDDTISFVVYNDAARTTFQSVPFEVTSGSGWIDPNGAKDVTGATPGGTMTYLDALGRPLAVQDPAFGSPQEPGIACSAAPNLSGKSFTACVNYGLGTASGDATTYHYTQSIDPNNHMALSFADVLGRTRSTQQYSGHSGNITTNIVQQKSVQYNALNEPTSVLVTDLAPQAGQTVTSVTTTAGYDDLGRLTHLVDPDRGTHTLTYDADGQVLTDVSGTRTLGYSYDLLGRLGCQQDAAPTISATGACSGGSHPFVQNTYDTSTLGVQGSTDFSIGDLTKSVSTTYYPDGTQAAVTQQMQHDQRGQLTATTMQLGLPSSWNVTTPLPTYQLAQAYNDVGQPTTTTTSTSNPGDHGYVFTQVYDGTTGVQTGLSSTNTPTANLATLAYNVNAMVSALSFQTSTGSALANEQFSYDLDLRPTRATGTWQAGSGTSGTILDQSIGYDAAGNVSSQTTTQASVQGQSVSGGSETQVFCYDEQNRLVWASNAQATPSAGNGTCGSGTPGNSLSGAGYLTTPSMTHLGQLWRGSLNGSATQYQYLYCDSSHPHRLTGLYPVGTTCATLSGAVYSIGTTPTNGYDAWGNAITRISNGVTATLSYDALDELVQWSDTASTNEWYVYDSSGERVLRRSSHGGATSLTVYAFGLEEHAYTSSGVSQSNTHYYTLAGHLIGTLTGSSTQLVLTDALGSVLSTFSNTTGSASVQGNQVYDPYGTQSYHAGSMGTTKGFTGQYSDATGLDYYGARYYDPAVGIFLLADSVQGNAQGENPYAYVGGNPETFSDPTGQMYACPHCGDNGSGDGGGGGPSPTPTPQQKVVAPPPVRPVAPVDPPVDPPVEPNPGPGVIPICVEFLPECIAVGVVVGVVVGVGILTGNIHLPQHATGLSEVPQVLGPGQMPNRGPDVLDPFGVAITVQAHSSQPQGGTGTGGGGNTGGTGGGGGTGGTGGTGSKPRVQAGGGGKGRPPRPPVSAGPPSGDCGDSSNPPSKYDQRKALGPLPPAPEGMSLPKFGDTIGWGKGPWGLVDSWQRIFSITDSELAVWKQQGITQEMGQAWADRYAAEYGINPANETALGRHILMQCISDWLK